MFKLLQNYAFNSNEEKKRMKIIFIEFLCLFFFLFCSILLRVQHNLHS